jgi:hypothetical protein
VGSHSYLPVTRRGHPILYEVDEDAATVYIINIGVIP